MKQVRYALVAALALTTANAMRADLSITGEGGIIDMIAQYDRAAQAAEKDAAQAVLEQLKEVNKQATAPGQARSYIPIFMEKSGFDLDGIKEKEEALAQPSEEKRAQAGEEISKKIGSLWRAKRIRKLQAGLAQAEATEKQASDALDNAIEEKNSALAAAKTALGTLPLSKPQKTRKDIWDTLQSIKTAVESSPRISSEILELINNEVTRIEQKQNDKQTLSTIEENIFEPLSKLTIALTTYDQAEAVLEKAADKADLIRKALARAQAVAPKKASATRPETEKTASSGETGGASSTEKEPIGRTQSSTGGRAKGAFGRRPPSKPGRTASNTPQ